MGGRYVCHSIDIRELNNKIGCDMKTIYLSLYKFDELSKEAQQNVIEKERWNIMWQCMDCYGSDYKASLEKFDTLMGTEACDYSVDYSGYDFNYKINDMVICVNPIDCDKDIYPNNLCGKLLFRYINNNIMPYICLLYTSPSPRD